LRSARVVVAANQPLFRGGLARALREGDRLVIETDLDGVPAVLHEQHPEVVVLVATEPRSAPRTDLHRRWILIGFETCGRGRNDQIVELPADPEVALVSALVDRPGIVRTLTRPTADHERLLTARELEVMTAISMGLTTGESSDRLQISPKTVENHKQRIFEKLGVQNQAHAVAQAEKLGLLRDARMREARRTAV
jgi:DNA-binding NarL/FixJ family response regulator